MFKAFKNNEFISGQDPWVIKYKNSYLLIQSTLNGRRIEIIEFRDCLLKKKIKEKVIWVPKKSSNHSKMLWAPELHTFPNFNDKWYIYYAACEGDNKNHRMYVLESDTNDPAGSYHELGKITDKSDKWAIDLSVFEYRKKLYAIWSGWEDIKGDFPQNLYIAQMKNPWTISSKRVCISKPKYLWEKSIAAINEGPQVLKYKNKLFIIYSADASWMKEYKLGLLSFDGKDILDPKSWVKYSKPVFKSSATIFGPGHASFIKEQNLDYIIYHHKVSSKPGWERQIKVKPFEWLSNSFPFFGTPQ